MIVRRRHPPWHEATADKKLWRTSARIIHEYPGLKVEVEASGDFSQLCGRKMSHLGEAGQGAAAVTAGGIRAQGVIVDEGDALGWHEYWFSDN